jgi:two-component system cell cycle sensor histidine kinase/response regulator CckA
LDIFGYDKPEEVIGKSPTIVIHPDDRSISRQYRIQRERGEMFSEEYVHKGIKKDGTTIFIEASISETLYRGEPVAFIYQKDITERKMTEEALRESENKFRDMAEKAIVGIYVIQDKVFKYVNSRCAQIHGYEIEELVNKKKPWDMVLPEDVPIVAKNLQERMSGKAKSLRRDFRIVTKTQEIRYVETYGNHTTFQGKPATIGTIIDVTERKQAEEALEASKDRFRTLIEKLGEVISLNDVNRKRIYVSPSIKTILGYSAEEYLGLKWYDVGHPDELEMLEEGRAEMLKHPGEAVSFESRLRHKDGSWRWMESTARNLLDDPNVRAVVVNFHDITERKNAEEALRKSEEKYRNIFENAVEGIFQTTPEGQFLSANPALARMHGFETPDELMRAITSTTDQMYVDSGDHKKIMKLLEKQDVVKDFQTKMRKQDGSIIWISMTSRSVKDAMGKIKYHEGVVQDITEQKEAENKLRESEERYRTAIEHSNDGVGLVSNGQYIYVNQKFLDIFGYEKPEDVIGKRPLMTVHPDDFELLKEYGGKRQRGELAPEQYEYKGIRKDGTTIFIEVSIAETTYQGGPVVLSYLRDVTERKRTEEALKRSEERFRTLVEKSAEVILLYDNDRNRIYVSPTITKILGYTIEEILPMHWPDFVHPDDIKTVETSRSLAFAHPGETVVFINRLRHKDGTWRWVENSTCNLLKEPGIHALVVNFHDITERKLVEEALKQNEERFRALAEKSAEVILLTDKNGQYAYVSPSITRILGYTVEEFLVLDKTDLVHPDDVNKITDSRSRVLANPGETVVFTNRLRHKDGSWHWAESTIRNLLDEPSVHSLVANIHDITDRKLAEEGLKQSEERFRALVEKSSDVIFLNDESRKGMYVSPSITRILGYTVEEFLSLDRTEFTHPDDMAKVETARSHIMANPSESVTFVDRMRHKNGSWRWAECTIRNLLDEPSVHALVVNFHDITERKMAEEALRESENKFKDLAEKSFIGIYIIQDRVFKYVNARFAEIHGYAVRDIINKKHAQEMVFLEDLPSVKESIRARSSGTVKSLHYEFRIVTKTGEIKYVEVFGTRTIYQGKPATIGAINDVTERKNAEEALIKSEEKYRNIFENAVEGIFQTTPEGQFLSVNPAFVRIFDFDSPEELIASTAGTIEALYANLEDRRTMIDTIKARSSAEGFETQFIRKDGKKIWVSINSQAIRDKNNKTVYYEGTIMDITNRKLAEEALQESEAKYRNVVDHLIVGFYIIQDNRFRFVNRRFCEMSGYSYDELVDKAVSPSDLIHDDDKKLIAGLEVKRLSGETDYTGSVYKGVKKDGQIMIVKGLSNLIIYNGHPAIAGTVIDITRETSLESQLRQAQKMEAVGTLAGGIAHDFNNILTAIIGYGRLLQMKMTETDPLRTYVAHMLSSSETAANLTRNLLTFSRKQIVELKPIKVGKIVKGMERLLKSLLTEDIALKIISPDPDITIMADMSQIEQVLLNLASNANDAMPRGGTLAIETKEVNRKNIFVDGYNYIESGQYAFISVADTGTGIDERTRSKIFEPFFTTKEVGKGTGLGLSIVHGIVDQHHGYITVDSTLQGGTVFSIYFPAIKAAVDDIEALYPVVEGGTETILVAEDDAQVRSLTTEVLGSAGYTVLEAIDGEDAVEQFIKHSDTVDLLLLDVVMPRKNGKEAHDEIKKINPDVRVIFMSGYTGDVIIGKGIIEKEYAFIQKPLSPNELLLRVKEALNR